VLAVRFDHPSAADLTFGKIVAGWVGGILKPASGIRGAVGSEDCGLAGAGSLFASGARRDWKTACCSRRSDAGSLRGCRLQEFLRISAFLCSRSPRTGTGSSGVASGSKTCPCCALREESPTLIATARSSRADSVPAP